MKTRKIGFLFRFRLWNKGPSTVGAGGGGGEEKSSFGRLRGVLCAKTDKMVIRLKKTENSFDTNETSS